MTAHKFIFLGPLGWKNNIWNKVMDHLNLKRSSDEVLFFSFPNTSMDVESSVYLCKEEINKCESCTLVAASYGGMVLLSILESIKTKVNGIILIEPLLMVPKQDELTKIRNNRVYKFENYASFLDSMLNEKEKEDAFLSEIMESVYCFNKNEHFMSNDELQKCFLFFEENEQEMISHALLESIFKKYNTIILTNDESYFKQYNVKIREITLDDHMLMLTRPEYLADIIKSVNSRVDLTNI